MADNSYKAGVRKGKVSTVATNVSRSNQNNVFVKNEPTKDTPLSNKVGYTGGTLVRSGRESSSAQVAQQRRLQQNEAFEQRFESKFNHLKGNQAGGSGMDPRAEGFNHGRLLSDDCSLSPRDRNCRDDDDRRGSRRDRDDRDRESRDKGDTKGASSGSFVPRLASPGSKGGPSFLPPPSSSGSGAGSGTAAGSSTGAGAAGGGDFDLLGVGDPGPAQTQQPQQQPSFDPFSAAPTAAPPQQLPSQGSAISGADDWAGFQGGGGGQGFQSGCQGMGAASGNQAMFNPMQPQMQMGMAPGGLGPGQQAAPQGGSWGMPQGQPQASSATGWGASPQMVGCGGCAGCGMQQQQQQQANLQMGWGGSPQMGACGMQQQQPPMGAQQSPMGSCGMMGMGQGQMPMQQQQFNPQAQQQNQNWGAFAPAPAYSGGSPSAAMQAPMPGASMPGASMPGMQFPGMGAGAASAAEENLMSKAIAGVDNIGAQLRRQSQQQQQQQPMGAPMGMQPGMMSMNMMGSQMR